MGKPAFEKKKYRLKRDVYVPWDLLESEAFKTLSAMGIRVLLRFYQKRTWTDISKKKRVFNNSGLAFTYAEAEILGIGKSQFHQIIKKLVEVGFVDIEHQGGGLARDYSRYCISERWRDYGTPNFKQVLKPRVLQQGLDVQSWKRRKKATGNRTCQVQEIVLVEAIN